MVRKIPTKKHRGVKDPLVQLARRNACPTINAPPKDPQAQELPKSLLEIQRLCQIAKNYDRAGNKKNRSSTYNTNNDQHELIDSYKLLGKDPRLPGMKQKSKGMPRIVQRPGEGDDAFYNRFSAAAQEFINKVNLENKHEAKLNSSSKNDSSNSDSSGNLKESNSRKRKGDVVDLSEPDTVEADDNNVVFTSKRNKKFIKTSNFDVKNKSKERGTKPNKRERRKIRQAHLKKEDHYESEDLDSDTEIDFTCLKDDVKFGEVVHRPPQFTAKPRGSELNSRPGTKDLLLKQIMSNPKENSTKKKDSSNKLSNAQKHFLEKERLRVVQAYREMKLNKIKR